MKSKMVDSVTFCLHERPRIDKSVVKVDDWLLGIQRLRNPGSDFYSVKNLFFGVVKILLESGCANECPIFIIYQNLVLHL